MRNMAGIKTVAAARKPRVLLLACAVVVFSGCWKPQPEKPIELHLTLAKPRIQAGEFLWYRVAMTNVGRKPIKITDQFWCWQGSLLSDFNKAQTTVEIVGPDGEKVYPDRLAWGYYNEHHFWTNDPSVGAPCASNSLVPTKPLEGGETWIATPSKVAPVRKRNPHIFDDMGDARALPEIPKGRSPQQIEKLKKQWKASVEQSGYLNGDPTFRSTATASGIDQPQGYRVLEIYDFDKPGKYRMRLVYSPFGRNESPNNINRIFKEDGGVKSFLATYKWPTETRVFDFKSNWVEFEVTAAPFPEHLFIHRKGETRKQREQTNRLERLMKKRFPGSGDAPKNTNTPATQINK